MPYRRRSFSRQTRRSARRRYQWVDFIIDTPALAPGHFMNYDVLSQYRPMAGAESAGITAVRVHTRVWVTSSPVTEGDGLVYAMIVDNNGEVTTSAQPYTAGSVVLDPVDNPYANWMIYQRYNAHPTYNFMANNNMWEHDTKSKRRIPFGDTLILHLGNLDAAANVTMSSHTRALIALS